MEISRPRPVVTISIGLLIAVLFLHIGSVVLTSDREPHMDETEYLHAGWLMRNGGKLYGTFFEHHSPFLFAALSVLAPVGEAVPARPYFVRARLLTGLAGLVALMSLAILLRRAAFEAPAIGTALLLASGPLWLRGFAEVRGEAFALAFFLAGAVLVFQRRGVGSGIGIALVAASVLWNPKWPFASLMIGVIFIYRVRGDLRAYIAGILGTAAAFAAIAAIVPLDVWWFFNFDVNWALSRAVQSSRTALDTYFGGGEPFHFVPDAFHPKLVVPAALIVLGALIVKPQEERVWPLLLLAATLADLRFILPWPGIWAHYYLMWGIASAAVLAVVPVSIELLLRKSGVSDRLVVWIRTCVVAAAAVMLTAHLVALRPWTVDGGTYWVSERYLRERLEPGDVVWLEPARHPVTIHDAHYYWYLVGQMSSSADLLRRTERGRQYLPPTDGLPTCVPPERLRFTLDPGKQLLTGAGACLDRLKARGQVRETVFPDVLEVRLVPSPGKVVQ